MNSGEMNGGIEALLKQHRVEQFLFLEARLIDERRFSEWEALWVDEGIYWVPANGEDTDPHTEVSLIYDNRSRMHNRVERFSGGKAISQQPPPRTVHLVANVTIEPATSEAADNSDVLQIVHSTVQVGESRPGIRVDWVGRVTHHLAERDGALRIVFKKVVLVDNDRELTTLDFVL
ncbi:MAG: benzoate/toluate 1,2-dioxygenase beta subunit [Candidatus Poriferisodalaceae bacterium]|jgi:benzoate/toluate 1,2-dioxygenase subunit beta